MKAKKAERIAELANKTLAEQHKMMSIKEKLERKLETEKPIIVKMDYTLGEENGIPVVDTIDIPFKIFSAYEADRITKITTIELPATKDEGKQDELNNELFTILGDHCLDKELDKAFWMDKKGYAMKDFFTSLMKVLSDSSMPDQKYMEEVSKFQRK